MIRILHAADLHLDSPFAALRPEQARTRREEQRQVLQRLVQACNSMDCRLLLLSGDLFDSDRVFRQTAELLCDVLGQCRARVFIAPGNHDYYGPFSPYASLCWPENVHIFRSRTPEAVRLEDPGLTVYGAAFTAPHDAPLLEGFHAGPGLSVMTVHGELTATSGLYGPIPPQQAEESGLSYLALGHIHRGFVKTLGGVTVGNPGCAMGRGFDETGEKGALCVELDEGGCRVKPVPLGARQYSVYTVNVTGKDPLAAALAALPEKAKEEICRVVFTGTAAAPPDARLIAALEEKVRDLEIVDQTLPELELWAGLEEDSLKGVFLRRMKAVYDEAAPEDRPTAAAAARLTLSLMEGREVAEE